MFSHVNDDFSKYRLLGTINRDTLTKREKSDRKELRSISSKT